MCACVELRGLLTVAELWFVVEVEQAPLDELFLCLVALTCTLDGLASDLSRFSVWKEGKKKALELNFIILLWMICKTESPNIHTIR